MTDDTMPRSRCRRNFLVEVADLTLAGVRRVH